MLRKLFIMISFCCLFANTANAEDFSDYISAIPRKIENISFTDIDGNIHNLNSLKGKVVLLNFWATWCGPCVKEMPSLSRLKEYLQGENVEIIPIAVVYKGGAEEIEEFYKKLKINNLPVFIGDGGHRKIYVNALPTTIILNQEGGEVARVTGDYEWDSPEVRKYLLSLTK